MPDNPGTVGINFATASDPQWAAERLGQIMDAANEAAGKTFHAVGSGAFWPETGETLKFVSPSFARLTGRIKASQAAIDVERGSGSRSS